LSYICKVKGNEAKINTTIMKKILVGGQALRNMGSDRYTSDVDYLIKDENNTSAFIHDVTNDIDYLNASGNKFFNEIYKLEEGNDQASAQSLLELKAYAFVQHCQNFNFKKADACEYDIKFLVRFADLKSCKIAVKYMTAGEYSEVEKIILSVKK